MIFHRLTHYVNGKVFEWVMTSTTLGMGFLVLYWPKSGHAGVFNWVAEPLQGQPVGVVLLIVGMFRLLGLLLNGQRIQGIKLGPWIRAIFCVVCAFFWSQFVVGLFQLSVTQGYPSPGIPLWFSVTIGELYIAYRARANAG